MTFGTAINLTFELHFVVPNLPLETSPSNSENKDVLMSQTPEANHRVFRAGVGAMIINNQGKVLAFERIDVKDCWQLPQGGLEGNELPANAVVRELNEETGLTVDDVELLAEHPNWLAYEFPPEVRAKKLYRGQVQKWFLFRLVTSEKNIRLDHFEQQEFVAWRWMTIKELSGCTVSFKSGLYERVAQGFADYLAR